MDEESQYCDESRTSPEELELELNYVRNTYNQIASHFSDTRYNKWPKIHEFVANLAEGSILLDIGCGNGKYLDSNKNIINIGCDSSSNLLSICRERDYNVFACDMIKIPIRPKTVDVIICIAALHHLSSYDRRKQCLNEMVNTLTKDGLALIYVWSFEQDLGKPNAYLKKSYQSGSSQTIENEQLENSKLPIHKNRTPFIQQDILVPFSVGKQKHGTSKSGLTQESSEDAKIDTYLRYYHVFKRGELDSMIAEIPAVAIIDSYYDNGNWCLLFRKLY